MASQLYYVYPKLHAHAGQPPPNFAAPLREDFAPSWDRHVLTFFEQTRNDYAVLSTYPANLHGER